MSFVKIAEKLILESVYYITEVHYTRWAQKGDPSGIETVRAHEVSETKRDEKRYSVPKVISMIEDRKARFFTARWIDGKWRKGQIVHVHGDHIRSKPNGIKADNLENLPEF